MKEEKVYNIHHRLCKSWTKDKKGGYPIEILKKLHDEWHDLFQNYNMFIVAKIINYIFGDPRYKFVVVRREHETKTDRQRDWRENKKYYRRYIPRSSRKDIK